MQIQREWNELPETVRSAVTDGLEDSRHGGTIDVREDAESGAPVVVSFDDGVRRKFVVTMWEIK